MGLIILWIEELVFGMMMQCVWRRNAKGLMTSCHGDMIWICEKKKKAEQEFELNMQANETVCD